jgi:hypothetical protein
MAIRINLGVGVSYAQDGRMGEETGEERDENPQQGEREKVQDQPDQERTEGQGLKSKASREGRGYGVRVRGGQGE